MPFRRLRLEGLDFADADLGGCGFRDAIMDRVIFSDALLNDTKFQGADLRGANKRKMTQADAAFLKCATI